MWLVWLRLIRDITLPRNKIKSIQTNIEGFTNINNCTQLETIYGSKLIHVFWYLFNIFLFCVLIVIFLKKIVNKNGPK